MPGGLIEEKKFYLRIRLPPVFQQGCGSRIRPGHYRLCPLRRQIPGDLSIEGLASKGIRERLRPENRGDVDAAPGQHGVAQAWFRSADILQEQTGMLQRGKQTLVITKQTRDDQ